LQQLLGGEAMSLKLPRTAVVALGPAPAAGALERGQTVSTSLSRRNLFKAGSGAAAAAALVFEAPGARSDVGDTSKNEATVRAWYRLWVENKDWAPFDAILADDFVFSSTNGEDHISKAEFKSRCWDTNINLINGFDLELVMTQGDQVFAKYLGHTTSGKTFRNVELHRLRDGRITSIECYFGGKATYAAALESQKS
jgi:ketosteroid isomerase-like protein